jgi:hypothetical protein
MGQKKKEIRKNFREAVLTRDGFICRMCMRSNGVEFLDAHHVIDRSEIENQGYVKENGITLCPNCHILAEREHVTGIAHPGYSRSELFQMIGSNEELARSKSKELQ